MTKKEARKKYREIRKMLTPTLVQMASNEICTQLKTYDFKGKRVHVFLPIRRLNEVDLKEFIEHCTSEGVSLCTSVSDFSTHEMQTIELTSKTELKENEWGIPEPINGKEIHPEEIDVIIVPLLYADSNGNRVGYGKGFYDRFLSSCRADVLKIGVNFFAPRELLTDVESTDIKLDELIYPKE